MREENKKKIEEIMAGMRCLKDFQCAKSGFDRLCKTKDFGLEDHLECLEENPQACSFAMPFGNGHFCQCPLRIHLDKKLKFDRLIDLMVD